VNLDNFMAHREPSWRELQFVVNRAGAKGQRLDPAEIRHLGELYRATAADLAIARREFPTDAVTDRLNRLVSDARLVVYQRPRDRNAFLHFVTTGYWQRVRERPRLLIVSALLLFGTWALCMQWAISDPASATRFIPAASGWTAPKINGVAHRGAVATYIIENNVQVIILALAGGIFAGLGTVAALVYNGAALGATAGLSIVDGNSRALFEWIPAHGFLELSCIVVSGMAGLRLGGAILAPGNRRRGAALIEEGRAAVELVLGTAMWLIVAGLIEGFVSPAWLGIVPVLIIGSIVGGSYWTLVIVRGKPDAPAFDPYDAATPERAASLAGIRSRTPH
jgi:uncharacterized membrane protein SpoIIM required for sporulation